MIEVRQKNLIIRLLIGFCIALAVLSVLSVFSIPDGMQGEEQSNIDGYIVRYFMLGISFSLFLIVAFCLWVFLLHKEKLLKKEKRIHIAFTLLIVLLYIFFFISNAFDFYRRYHAVSFQEMVEKYEKTNVLNKE